MSKFHDISVVAKYSLFLRKLGFSDNCTPDELDITGLSIPENLLLAFFQNRMGELSDEEIVSFYELFGAMNCIRVTKMSVKIAQFMMLAGVIPENTRSIVEFGGGPGVLANFIRKEIGCKISVLDACMSYLHYCQMLSLQLQIEVPTIHSLGDETPLESSAYDLAFAIDMIDCSSRWEQIIREMARVARNVAVIYTPYSRFRYLDPRKVRDEFGANGLVITHDEVFNPSHLVGGDDTESIWFMITGARR